MAGLVRTIIDLKSKVESLEEKVKGNKSDDVEVLVDKQKAVDEAIAKNSAAIIKIDEEIQVLMEDTERKRRTESTEGRNLDGKVLKCRYYDRGHCKYKCGCKYIHSKTICKDYLDNKKCDSKSCIDRHPKVCKFWIKNKGGCKRNTSCDFLHVTLARNEDKPKNSDAIEEIEYTCVGCNSSWTDDKFVIKYNIKNHIVNFCLNCDDWVKDKAKVLDENWTMFDNAGNLRYDV